LAVGVDDSVLADVVAFEASAKASEPLELYVDETAVPGKTYFYRIKGVNVAGDSGYSNVLKVN